MDKELELVLAAMGASSRVSLGDRTYHTARWGDHELIIGKTGIGKVNAAIATVTLLDNFHPALVINSGVAGGVGVARPLDVVVPSAIAYHDVWCGPGTEPGVADGMPARFTCPLEPATVASLGALTGLLASGDIFVSTADEVARIRAMYPDAVAVDMESAAIAHACRLRGVPFVCLRVVSDTPGAVDDNVAQYDAFWTEAPRRTFDTLLRLLHLL